MNVQELTGAFGLDRVVPATRPTPEPGPGQVRIRMRAASLNYRDLLMVKGQYNPRLPLPMIPASDGVGIVESVGAGVSPTLEGTRVCPTFSQAWLDGPPDAAALRSTLGGPLDGVLAEQMVVHADATVPVPEHLSDEEAACLPCAALTAWSALAEHGNLKPGDTVLTLGSGGVSLFALAFAQMFGARVIATSSCGEKLERLEALGAAKTLNYREDPRWGRTVRKLTGGVDHVVEVGGAGTLEQSLAALRPGGSVSLIGVLSGGVEKLSLFPILMNNIRVQGIFVGHRRSFHEMNRAITAHQFRPVVDRSFPLSETRAALEYLASGQHMGKVVIRISE